MRFFLHVLRGLGCESYLIALSDGSLLSLARRRELILPSNSSTIFVE